MFRSTRRALACCALIDALAACGAGPADYPVSGTPVTLLVPKDLDGPQAPLAGVLLQPARQTESDNGDIEEFSAVDFPSAPSGTLTVRTCRGDKHDTGSVYQSCISFDASVDVVEEAEQRRLTLTPSRRRDEPGRNALFLPISMPKMALPDWYYYVSHHEVRVKHQIKSPFPSEALKASFDRHLRRLEEGVADGATRQFADAYGVGSGGSISTRVGAAFYPYQTGSIAEIVILAGARGGEASATIDWTTHLRGVKQKLEEIATN